MFKDKRTLVYGRNIDDLIPLLPKDIELVKDDPELVISYGGDGSLLGAERTWPGVPKIAIRDYRHNPKCSEHSERQVISLAVNNKLPPRHLIKLEAFDEKGRRLEVINDIVIHNADPRSAIRYAVMIDGRPFPHQMVGDGVVVATTFGSSAYYKSITGSVFYTGIGLAFNNSTEPMDHLVLSDESVIEVIITRGPAVLLGDNSPQQFIINEGEKVTIKKSITTATIHGIDIFRCPDCYALRKQLWKSNISAIVNQKK